MERSLETLREDINKIDENIIELLSRRMEVAKEIAILKKNRGIQVEDKERESQVFLKIQREARDNLLDQDFVSELFGIIISHSKKIQNKLVEDHK
ncbi:MAG: chorismate mutase [Candidatus Methanofastidiosum methylothiophilum]|jgi:chorismate mutase|uniref:Chorismate mutase n=1 Tax=Candidatus Methanofastidiosum methylothiophilum TaxID=1705564 RepID=A0A150INI4_9EURY|nr:MAG: chorismate mutase [Candidatus Methanofastidiosum methylthiophilus]NMC77511.1 chorismate mutase [Candidatus Methanofastidiosa archaeon]